MIPALHRELSFLDDLEIRQNEVLSQLEDLERRVENLLNEFLQARGENPAESKPVQGVKAAA